MIGGKNLLIFVVFLFVTANTSAIIFSDPTTTFFELKGCCECYEDVDCDNDYYSKWEYFCKDGNVYYGREFHDWSCGNWSCHDIFSYQEKLVEICAFGCKDGKCIIPEKPECCNDYGCPSDYYSDNYCKEGNVYHDLHNFYCQEGKCVEQVISQLVEICDDTCIDRKCRRIECYKDSDCDDSDAYTKDVCVNPGSVNSYCQYFPLKCLKDSDCGEDSFVGERYCQNNNVHQDYQTFSCLNAGTTETNCTSSIASQLIKECEHGCLNGICTEPTECYTDEDCGSPTSELVCVEDDVYKKITSPKCTEGSCKSIIELTLVEECEDGCEDGACVEEEKERERNTRETKRKNYCGDGVCDRSIGENELTCYGDCKIQKRTEISIEEIGGTNLTQANELIKLDKEDSIVVENNILMPILFLLLIVILIIIIIMVVIVS